MEEINRLENELKGLRFQIRKAQLYNFQELKVRSFKCEIYRIDGYPIESTDWIESCISGAKLKIIKKTLIASKEISNGLPLFYVINIDFEPTSDIKVKIKKVCSLCGGYNITEYDSYSNDDYYCNDCNRSVVAFWEDDFVFYKKNKNNFLTFKGNDYQKPCIVQLTGINKLGFLNLDIANKKDSIFTDFCFVEEYDKSKLEQYKKEWKIDNLKRKLEELNN
jgi:hypothetical protein